MSLKTKQRRRQKKKRKYRRFKRRKTRSKKGGQRVGDHFITTKDLFGGYIKAGEVWRVTRIDGDGMYMIRIDDGEEGYFGKKMIGKGLRKVKRAKKQTKRVRFGKNPIGGVAELSPGRRERKGFKRILRPGRVDEATRFKRWKQREAVFAEWDDAAYNAPSTHADPAQCRYNTSKRLDRCRLALENMQKAEDSRLIIKERFSSAGRKESECRRLIAQCEGELDLMKFLTS